MRWLLWREFRLNRLILATAVILIPLPHIVVALITWPAAERDSAYFHAYLFSTVLSAMIVVELASNSIAPDHADRSVPLYLNRRCLLLVRKPSLSS